MLKLLVLFMLAFATFMTVNACDNDDSSPADAGRLGENPGYDECPRCFPGPCPEPCADAGVPDGQ